MAVYLGENGRVLLSRSGGKQPMFFELQNSDINVARRRFAVPGSGAQFITGDVLEISTLPTQDNIPLELVPNNKDDSGKIYNSFEAYVHVDALGGLRLYEKLDDAIPGGFDKAVVLGEFTNKTKQLVSIRVVPQSDKNCLAHIRDFQITTTRENIDITCLSNRYRQEYEDGLIQGQGTLNCFWDYLADQCPNSCNRYEELQAYNSVEFAEYLAQLCIRLVQGCDFHGYFFLYYSCEDDEKSTWYECADCLVTNVVVNVEPTQLITAQIEFVTSGPIVLRHGYPPKFILQEDDGVLLQENGDGILLDNPTD